VTGRESVDAVTISEAVTGRGSVHAVTISDATTEPTLDGGTAGAVRRVYVRGVRSLLGWCVADLLRATDGLQVVVASGDAPAEPGHFDTIVDVGLADHDLLGRRGESVTAGANDLLVDAAILGADHLVVVSSAMVYGAIANNPVPLTEAAVLRPDPTFVYARQLASAEESVEQWRTARPDRRVTMLRPVVPVSATGTSSLARALTAGFGQRFGEDDPGAQFVHHDDVATAVRLAVVRRLDGVYNVAPDGSIPGERVRALSGQRWRLPLPDRVADVVGALRWRFQRGPIPPGLRSYTRAPWTVANDKLRAEGWAPTVTNEQAYVEGTEAKWWTMVTPKRRQEIALGALVVLLVVGGIVGVVLARRWWRRRAR
jgi:nucleoside-diphosphate-sugar epimerase